MLRYLVVIERANGNYSAYVPDLPGCMATGKTLPEVREKIREAMDIHIRGLREDGLPIPTPTSSSDYMGVSCASP